MSQTDDQALSLEDRRPGRENGLRPVWVVGSGKGGTGKSMIAVLLARLLAERGRKVLLVDGSQNLGHLHVLLGVSSEIKLEQIHRGDADPAELVRAVSDRLYLLPSDSGSESLYGLPAIDQARLYHRLTAIFSDYDLVIVDASPGIEVVIRLATLGGTRLIVVTNPDVAALTDAYAVIKLVYGQLPGLPIDVVINKALEDEVLTTFERLDRASSRFLGKSLRLAGGVPDVPEWRQAMRRAGGLREVTAGPLWPVAADLLDHDRPLDDPDEILVGGVGRDDE